MIRKLGAIARVALDSVSPRYQRVRGSLMASGVWLRRVEMRKALIETAKEPVIAIGMLALVVDHSAPAINAVPDSAAAVYRLVLLGGAAVLAGTLLGAAVSRPWGRGAALSHGVRVTATRVMLLWLALGLIRLLGTDLDSLVGWIVMNPHDALTLLAAAAVLHTVFAVIPDRPEERGYEALPAFATVTTRRVRSASDIFRTAVHEAGHLLLYAARPELPSDLTVTVLFEIGPTDTYRGQVTHTEGTPDIFTESYMWWSMLLHLGGSEAEAVVLGDRGDGSQGDYLSWMGVANAFLANGFGQAYFVQSSGDEQREHNRAVLNDLKARGTYVVSEYLLANSALLADLAHLIVGELTLTREQLEPLLSRAIAKDLLDLRRL